MEVIKAERGVISVAGSEIEVFMLPNGEYRYSQASAAKAIGLGRNDLNMYLERTNPLVANDALVLQVKSARVKGLTDVAVVAYWQWKAGNGNKKALALSSALNTEALRRRADYYFNQTKTEEAYEAATTKLRQHILDKGVSTPDFYCDVPKEATAEERAVLKTVEFLKYAALTRHVDNHVLEARKELRSMGYALVLTNPKERNWDKAVFELQPVA